MYLASLAIVTETLTLSWLISVRRLFRLKIGEGKREKYRLYFVFPLPRPTTPARLNLTSFAAEKKEIATGHEHEPIWPTSNFCRSGGIFPWMRSLKETHTWRLVFIWVFSTAIMKAKKLQEIYKTHLSLFSVVLFLTQFTSDSVRKCKNRQRKKRDSNDKRPLMVSLSIDGRRSILVDNWVGLLIWRSARFMPIVHVVSRTRDIASHTLPSISRQMCTKHIFVGVTWQ